MAQDPMVPAVLRDLAGREMDVELPITMTRALVTVGPIGALVFEKTDETSVFGYPIFQQVDPAGRQERMETVRPSRIALA